MRCVLFDLDGVLVLSEPAHAAAYERLFRPYGVAFSAEDYRKRALGRPRAWVIRHVLGDRPAAEMETLMADKARYTTDYVRAHGLPEVDGAVAFARSLSVPRAVVTTSRTPDLFLGAIGASDVFDVVVDGSMVKEQKPSPEGYLRGAAGLGVDARDAVVIEDSPSGVAAGLASGAFVIGLTTTRAAEDLSAANVVVDGYAAVQRVLNDL